MNRLFIRHLLAVVCTTFLCVGTVYAAETEEVPFPEVVTVEKPEHPAAELTEALPWVQSIGYNPDDAYLYRIHNDAYYHLVAYSDTGDIVQLHDASKWFIHYNQRYLVLQWVQSDDIFIKPQASCFSSYQYVLHNRTLQQTVEANLINPPLPMGAFTFRIVNIDPYARLVHLSDNTVWQIDFKDRHFPYWQIGQRVLVGVNNNWRSAPRPHILINADIYKEPYSQADFYGYPVGMFAK
jgi:hypothetical protein